jgi:hypothetical protein
VNKISISLDGGEVLVSCAETAPTIYGDTWRRHDRPFWQRFGMFAALADSLDAGHQGTK